MLVAAGLGLCFGSSLPLENCAFIRENIEHHCLIGLSRAGHLDQISFQQFPAAALLVREGIERKPDIMVAFAITVLIPLCAVEGVNLGKCQ
jgi:hypothetical protein